MTRRSVEIISKNSLHPRRAAVFAKAAGHFKCEIAVINGDYRVDGKSILGLISLEPQKGSRIIIETDGEDEIRAVETLAKILEGQHI